MRPFPGFKKAHFVGIGGAGMSGIAEVMHSRGFEVSGSDLAATSVTEYLSSLGISVVHGHAVDNVSASDVVVYSSAVPVENPELKASEETGIPVIRRARLLGEMMKKKWSLAVSGTHGKTTTTLMLGAVWREADRSPTVIGGGIPQGEASGVSVGEGPYLIVEADEYDKSFLEMFPTVLLITNIDADHLECYGDVERLRDAFVECASRIPFCGFAVVNIDDGGAASVLPRLPCRTVTYGFSHQADYRAADAEIHPGGCRFSVYRGEKKISVQELKVFGRHNISNALGAFALSHSLGISEDHIQTGLGGFRGARRRIESLGEAGEVSFIDDYAHHPEEVKATLETLREAFGKRTVVVFQPHLFSRTKLLGDDFARALLDCDELFITPVYRARELPLEGVEGNLIADRAGEEGHARVHYLPDRECAASRVAQALKPGDLFVTMGAGDVWEIGREVMEIVEAR